ncbi:helitron helicase-like protein [Elysia marginata]|uniref:Helitron helicase-like protein n=1 Tax=Elysia marginata TaxID=1093978 RepID=A0AAV4GD03_9GAST|nr:helitron helicase-like protein [Elysia marginata]
MIDLAVSAETSDPDNELHHTAKTHMLHGPCGADNPVCVCMRDGKYTKMFPKKYLPHTKQGADGYPKYRRRSPEERISVKKAIHQKEVTLDKKWPVSYNPYLLHQMNCHLNIELCSSVLGIKYVLKYVHKGRDQSAFQLQDNNVMTRYQTS